MVLAPPDRRGCAVAGGGPGGLGVDTGSAPSYRTSVVGTGTVVATLDSVATITPVNQANLNFNVSGTVSSVDVSVGQSVVSGQTLASLDVADLDANVISAQATLASATATLARAEASEATTASAPSSSTSGAVFRSRGRDDRLHRDHDDPGRVGAVRVGHPEGGRAAGCRRGRRAAVGRGHHAGDSQSEAGDERVRDRCGAEGL